MLKTQQILDIKRIRGDFPILSRNVNGKQLVYLDNSATTQKPKQVISAMTEYYENYNANVHRGIHKLSEEATLRFEEAHQKTADFINANGMEEIIFTKNATESLNLVAYSYGLHNLKEGDEIIISQMEHHSNFVPWQQIAKIKGAKLRFIEITNDGMLNTEHFESIISNKTRIVALTHCSNVLGTINPVEEIANIAHEHNALFLVDGAQSVPQMPVDVRKIDCDFLAFSGHKMLGPTGIGVLFGKKDILSDMKPFLYGGDMIREVRFDDTRFNDLPWKFEAGTPNIAEAIGLGAAVDYLNRIAMESVREYERELVRYAMDKLTGIEGIEIYGHETDSRGGVISFNLKGIHSHDVASLLNDDGIAIRGGHHCAMPLMSVLGINGSARASFYIYNKIEEIDKLMVSLERAKRFFE